MSFWTGATEGLTQILAQRDLERRQALLDAIHLEERRRKGELEEREFGFRQQQEARVARAQEEAQRNLEGEKAFRRASTIAQVLPKGAEVTPDLERMLAEHGLDVGVLQRQPGVVLPLARPPAPMEPSALPGEVVPLPTEVTGPKRVTSLGGWKVQEAEAAQEARAEQARDAQQARLDQAKQHEQFLATMQANQLASTQAIAAANRQNTMAIAALGRQGTNELRQLQIEQLRDKNETARTDRDKSRAAAQDTTQTALDSVDKLLKHPGIGKATGALEWRAGLSQEATDFNAERDFLVAALTLPNLGALKGPMSDKDVIFVKQIATKLANPRMSEEATRAELARARAFLQTKLGTAQGSTPPPPPGGGGAIQPPPKNPFR